MAQELRRKSIHLLGLVVPIFYSFASRDTTLVFVGLLTAVAFGVEILKVLIPSFRQVFLRIFSPMLRSHERNGGITGATYYLVGSLLCIVLFDKTLAIVCLCFLTLGDLFAAIIGKRWGRIRIFSGKTLEGSLACFVVCAAIALFKLHPAVAITGAVVATLIELLPTGLNDNISMPLISGLVMHLLIKNMVF